MSSLFAPGSIGSLILENRLVVSPMCQYSAVDGVPQPWHLVHLGSMMMSGGGLVIVEATAVEPAGLGTLGDLGLWNDTQEAGLTELLVRLRQLSSAKIGIQLGHCGRKASTRTIPERWRGEPLPSDEGAWQPLAPSPIPYDEGWQTPQELDEAGIRRVIASFAESAKRALRAGFRSDRNPRRAWISDPFVSLADHQPKDRWLGRLARCSCPLRSRNRARRSSGLAT